MQTYSTTFAFLIVSLLGWMGVSHIATEGEVATVIDNLFQIIGIVGAFYGRYKTGGINALGVKK